MGKDHLFRLVAPKTWPIRRKTTKWIARPLPGPHPLKESITLSIIIRDILEYAKTTKEVKRILNNKSLLVDKVARTDYKFPVGFMDVIDFPSLNESYRVIYDDKGVFTLININKNESNLKLLGIIRKTIIKKGRTQVTLHDGRNIIVENFKGKIGDTILFDVVKKSVNKLLPLEKDSLVFLNGGTHIGSIGKVKDVIKSKDLEKPRVVVEIEGKNYDTLSKYAFVIGHDKPELSLGVKK